jgi:hypothetical protein
MNHDPSITVVIRSSGERTEAICQELVRAQGITDNQITIVRETPFANALRASYRAGMACGTAWTLCLDADVLLLPGSITRMTGTMERQHPSVFEIQGQILDKLFGGPRDGGIHLYRTSMLERGLECIPPEPSAVRPEFRTLEAMENHGFHWRRINYLTGTHAFEQYYRDIFRTCFVHARKHPEYAEIFTSYWPQQSLSDPDFQIALEGYAQGIRHQGDLSIDSKGDAYRDAFERLLVSEKPPLAADALSTIDVQQLVDRWVVPAVFRRHFRDDLLFHGPVRSRLNRMRTQVGKKVSALGIAKVLLYALGRGIEEVGIWLRGAADPYVTSHPENE